MFSDQPTVARGGELKFFTLKWRMGGEPRLRNHKIWIKMMESGHQIPVFSRAISISVISGDSTRTADSWEPQTAIGFRVTPVHIWTKLDNCYLVAICSQDLDKWDTHSWTIETTGYIGTTNHDNYTGHLIRLRNNNIPYLIELKFVDSMHWIMLESSETMLCFHYSLALCNLFLLSPTSLKLLLSRSLMITIVLNRLYKLFVLIFLDLHSIYLTTFSFF